MSCESDTTACEERPAASPAAARPACPSRRSCLHVRGLLGEKLAGALVERELVAAQLRCAPADHATPCALIVFGKQCACNAGRDALSADADRRNIAGDRAMAQVCWEGEAMDAVDPRRRVGRALEEFERRPDEWMIGLRKLGVAFRHEVIAPKPDVWLERRKFRTLAPVDGEPGRQNEEVEPKLPTRGVEQHATISDLHRTWLAVRENGKILAARDT